MSHFVRIDEPCSSCGLRWSMEQEEYVWWKTRAVEQNLHFPRKCKPCRFSEQIMTIANKLENNDLTPKETISKLRTIAEKLRPLGVRHVQKTKAVEVPAKS